MRFAMTLCHEYPMGDDVRLRFEEHVEQVRHARQIDDYRFTINRLAKCNGEFVLGLLIIHRVQKLAQVHRFALLIGQLNTNRIAALHHGDTR